AGRARGIAARCDAERGPTELRPARREKPGSERRAHTDDSDLLLETERRGDERRRAPHARDAGSRHRCEAVVREGAPVDARTVVRHEQPSAERAEIAEAER